MPCNKGPFPLVRQMKERMTDKGSLVKECMRGNPRAQKQLYDDHAEIMLGVCFRYTKSLSDAEDILQDAFVRVFTHLHQYREEGELGAWIRKIVVNTALNFLKRPSKNHERLEFNDDESTQPTAWQDPQVDLEAKELAGLIQLLPIGYQTVFNLFAIEGYAHAEIAQLLGIREVTSRSQYMRARTALAVLMEKHHSLQPKADSYGK